MFFNFFNYIYIPYSLKNFFLPPDHQFEALTPLFNLGSHKFFPRNILDYQMNYSPKIINCFKFTTDRSGATITKFNIRQVFKLLNLL